MANLEKKLCSNENVLTMHLLMRWMEDYDTWMTGDFL